VRRQPEDEAEDYFPVAVMWAVPSGIPALKAVVANAWFKAVAAVGVRFAMVPSRCTAPPLSVIWSGSPLSWSSGTLAAGTAR